MMLMLIVIRLGTQLVQQRGAHNPQRVLLGKKGDGVRPGLQVNGLLRAAVNELPASFIRLQDAEGNVFFQLLADRGNVRLPVAFKMAQILFTEQVQDFLGRIGFPLAQQVQNIEVERHIPGGEAFGLEGVIKGISGDRTAVHGQKYIFSVRGLAEPHEISQPAFHPAALIVIAPGALFVVFRPAFEAVYIELPHIIPDAVKIFYAFAVCHGCRLLPEWLFFSLSHRASIFCNVLIGFTQLPGKLEFGDYRSLR